MNVIRARFVGLLVVAAAAVPASMAAPFPPAAVDDLVLLKFAEGSGVRLRSGRFVSPALDLAPVERALAAFAARPARLSDVPEDRLEALHAAGEARTGGDVPDMNLWYELAVPPGTAAAAAAALASLAGVDHAYPAPAPAPPPGDIPPSTPDFRDRQGYAMVAPGGLDTRYAWNFPGGRGEGVFVIDIEYDWYDAHEDLERARGQKLVYTPRGSYRDHGTGVLGELVASDDRWGVTGLVPEARVGMVTQDPVGLSNSVARAITAATDLQAAGDVMLLEAQTTGPRGNYVPVEWNQAEYDAIRAATAKGIHVVEAAGNGNENLDDAVFNGRFNRAVRDSGAILVGAGAPPTMVIQPDRSRLSFSCYGSRLDVQGWGELVTTTGYGALWSGDAVHLQDYTGGFSGTSSASPNVAAAAAALSAYLKARDGAPPTPSRVRDLLSSTGSPQQAGPFGSGKIGPRPNLRAALRALTPASVLYESHQLADAAPGGNADGVLDPGETVDLTVCAYNASGDTWTPTTARLLPAGAEAAFLRLTGDERDLGLLAPAAVSCASSPPFRLVVQPDAPCGAAFRLPFLVGAPGREALSHVRLTVGRDGLCTPRTCAQPVPAVEVAGLRVETAGDDDLRFAWTGSAGAAGYRVWRSPDVAFGDARLAGATAGAETSLTIAGERARPTGALTFYAVRAVNACGWEGP